MAPTEQERREGDDVLRGLVRLMACTGEEKKVECIEILYALVKGVHLRTRYRQIAALMGVLIVDE